MPKYDFAHPTFKHGYVEFPVKKEPLMDILMREARLHKINVMRAQMIISTKNYMARVFNRISSIEIRKEGKSTILHNEEDIRQFIRSISNE